MVWDLLWSQVLLTSFLDQDDLTRLLGVCREWYRLLHLRMRVVMSWHDILFRRLHYMTDLQVLSFSCRLRVEHAVILGEVLQYLPQIHTLSIKFPQWRPECNHHIIKGIKHATGLTSLDMHGCNLTSTMTMELIRHVRVSSLGLLSNLMGQDEIHAIASANKYVRLAIGTPRIWFTTCMTIGCARDLGKAMDYERMHTLELQRCFIQGYDCLLALAQGLEKCLSLHRLVLKSQLLDDDAFEALIGRIPETVRYLDLSGNRPGQPFLAQLPEKLTHLILQDCYLEDDDVQALPVLVDLEEIDMLGNGITDSGLQFMMERVPDHIRKIGLSHNLLEEITALITRAREFTVLEYIGLVGNQISLYTANRLRAALVASVKTDLRRNPFFD